MKKYCSLFLLLFPLLLLAQNPQFAPGYPDKALQKPWGEGEPGLYDALIQPDGKTLIAGELRKTVWVNNPGRFQYKDRNFLLIRHLEDGSPDSSFGNHGALVIDGRLSGEFFYKVAAHSSGEIFALGKSDQAFVLAKFRADGSRDSTFGEKGFLQIFSSDFTGEIRDFALKPGGEIVLCGKESKDFLLIQLTAQGHFDSTFGDDGIARVGITGSEKDEDAFCLTVHQDSLLLVGGVMDYFPIVMRVDPRGKLDPTFSTNGYFLITDIVFPGKVWDLHIFKDQSFIAGGHWGENSDKSFFGAYTADGKPDPDRLDGKLSKPLYSSSFPFRSMAVSEKGEIFFQSYFSRSYLLNKLNPSGSPDTTFGFQGEVIFTIENKACFANNVMLSSTGDIRMTGSCSHLYSLVQLDSMGTFDPYFQEKGYINRTITGGGSDLWKLFPLSSNRFLASGIAAFRLPNNRGNTEAQPFSQLFQYDSQGEEQLSISFPFAKEGCLIHDVVQSGDGSLLVVGGMTKSSLGIRKAPFLTKIKADGTIDENFGENGFTLFSEPELNDQIIGIAPYAIHILADEKILVATTTTLLLGSFFDQKNSISLSRFLPNGQLDSAYFNSSTAVFDIPSQSAVQEAVHFLPLPSGKILLGGRSANIGIKDLGMGVACLSSDGFFEKFWGEQGENGYFLAEANTTSGGKLALHSSGYVTQAGELGGKIRLIQYTPEGEINPNFGENGLVTSAQEAGSVFFSDMEMAANGDLLVLGYIDNLVEAGYQIMLSRYDAFGRLRKDFGTEGHFIFDLSGYYNFPEDLLLREDDNIWICGNSNGQAFMVQVLSDLLLPPQEPWIDKGQSLPLLYPNPIRQSATLRYELAEDQRISISLIDLQGRSLGLLWQGDRLAGKHEQMLEFSPALAPGWYVIRVEMGETVAFVKIQKID